MNTLIKQFRGVLRMGLITAVLLPVGALVMGPQQAKAGGEYMRNVDGCRVDVGPARYVQQWRRTGTYVYSLPAGYKPVTIGGVHYYTYGNGFYFRSLADMDHVIYLQTP